MSAISERIKNLREKASLTAEDAAGKLGVTPEIYGQWENGESEPDTDTVFKMAKLYNTSADMILFGGEGRDAPLTMFPKSADPRFSPLASPAVLIGALMMFTGVGGALLLIMREIRVGVETFADMMNYGGVSLMIFAALFLAGLILAVVSAAVRAHRHKKEISEKAEKEGDVRFPWEKL